MTANDKLIYKLVQNNVEFAQEQFGENLLVNSEVLTNVLYDNLYKLVGERIEQEDFSNWLADELLNNGYVITPSSDASDADGGEGENPAETTYAVSEEQHQALVDMINQAIVLLKTQRNQIFKLFSDVNDQVSANGVQMEDEEVRRRRDEEIVNLVDTIDANHKKIQEYMDAHQKTRNMIVQGISGVKESHLAGVERRREICEQGGKIVEGSTALVHKIGGNWEDERKQREDGFKNIHQVVEGLRKPEAAPAIGGQSKPSPEPGTGSGEPKTSPIAHSPSPFRSRGKIVKRAHEGVSAGNNPKKQEGGKQFGTKIVGGKDKSKKSAPPTKKKQKGPGIFGKLKKKLGQKKERLKNRLSNSVLGKGYRTIKSIVKGAYALVKGVVKAAYKTAKFAVVATWKTAKFAVKTFFKASKLVGKAAVGAAKMAYAGAKKLVKLAQKGGLKAAIIAFSPAMFITKLGWKAVKFVGKKIWQGVKFLFFKTIGVIGGLFGLVGKFVNKVGHWIAILAKGVKDVTYRFLIKPIAAILVTVFNFVKGVVVAPIHFMKWLATSIMDRILSVMSAVKSAVKNVLKTFGSIFKKILFNPITIILLIGGIFFLFRKQLFGWLGGSVKSLKESIVTPLVKFAKGAWGFLKGVASVLFTVGKYIFKAIEWITNPKGMVAKFVVGVVKAFLFIKGLIKQMMKATGKSSVDVLCMFLAGDFIGIALYTLAGMIGKLWKWIKNTKLMKMVMGMVNTVGAVGKLIFDMNTLVYDTIFGAAKKILTGDFDGVVDAITAPWKNVWGQIKDLFSGKTFEVNANT